MTAITFSKDEVWEGANTRLMFQNLKRDENDKGRQIYRRPGAVNIRLMSRTKRSIETGPSNLGRTT
jgi:hypothetical protein